MVSEQEKLEDEMQEKKREMDATKNPKKANLLDHNSMKHILDESVTEIVPSKGYPQDARMSNIRLLIGAVIIVIAPFAQFYNKKFPENPSFLVGCIALYVKFNGILHLIIYVKEESAILFTYPPPGSFNSTGLVVTSKLPRFSDMFTLIIASAEALAESLNNEGGTNVKLNAESIFGYDDFSGLQPETFTEEIFSGSVSVIEPENEKCDGVESPNDENLTQEDDGLHDLQFSEINIEDGDVKHQIIDAHTENDSHDCMTFEIFDCGIKSNQNALCDKDEAAENALAEGPTLDAVPTNGIGR